MPPLTPIRSEALRAVGYDPNSRILTVQFSSGATYEYLDVAPELHEALREAQPHPWSALGDKVIAHEFRRLA